MLTRPRQGKSALSGWQRRRLHPSGATGQVDRNTKFICTKASSVTSVDIQRKRQRREQAVLSGAATFMVDARDFVRNQSRHDRADFNNGAGVLRRRDGRGNAFAHATRSGSPAAIQANTVADQTAEGWEWLSHKSPPPPTRGRG